MSRSGSSGDMPAPYQEALQEAARAIWAQANEFCFNEKVRMAETYTGKYREWEACSEEFEMMAKDALDVRVATKIGAVTQKMKREMNVEEAEIRRVTQLDVQQFKQNEEIAVQAALARASLAAQEAILHDRQLVQDQASRSEQQTVIKLREEVNAYAESQRDEMMKVRSHELSLAEQLKNANNHMSYMHNETLELRTAKAAATEFSETRERQFQEYVQQQQL